MSSPQVV